MKKFFLSLLSSEPGSPSSKRFRSIIFSVVYIVLAFLSAYGHTVHEAFIYTLAAMIVNESVMTVIDKLRNKM